MPVVIHLGDFTAHRWIAMLNSALVFQTGVRKLRTTSEAQCEAAARTGDV